MANTLTGHINYIFEAFDRIAREQVGLIPAVNQNFDASQAAVGTVIRSHVVPELPIISISPSVAVPDGGDMTLGYVDGAITAEEAVQLRWNGNEQMSIGSARYAKVMTDAYYSAFRALGNKLEGVIAALYVKASRSVGTAGTNPFGASNYNHDVISDALQVLKDNGTSSSDMSFVFNTTAGSTMRKIPNLYKVNEAGDTNFLRNGVLGDIHGFMLRESAGIKRHTKGTASGATTDTTGYAIGSTVITLASAGSGTILAGDSISFANDANVYGVVSGDSQTSNGGTITLAAPGLRQALPASAVAITVSATHTANLAFSRDAITLATRLPARPTEGDLAVDVMSMTDPFTGITYEISQYAGHRQVNFFVGLAYGAWASKMEGIVKVFG